jgi:hypothetical protein
MICTGCGNCEQGKRECKTPQACGAEVIGGTYFPKLAEARPVFALRNDHDEFCEDEPMSVTAKAFLAAVAFIVCAIVAAGLVDWLMS